METEKYEVHPEIAAEMPQTQIEEPQVEEQQQQLQQEVKPEQPKQEQETAQAKNFRALREQKERAERERDELARLLKETEARKAQIEDDFKINPDDIVEGKHLSRYDKKISKLQSELQQQQQRLALQATKLQLKSDYPDFDKVVNPETIAKFKDQYPHLASTLDNAQDAYSAGASAYTLFKKFGVYVEDNYEAERYKVQENVNKPKPVTSVTSQQGSSPLAKANAFANGLTDELRKQLIKETAEARKGL